MKALLIVVISYLLGAIPFALVIGKLWKGIDVREHGSGNIGATNAYRVMGLGPAAVIFLLDAGKGFLSAYLGTLLGNPYLPLICGTVATLAHTFSIFVRFKGGKGVATAFGMVLFLVPAAAGSAIIVWFVVMKATRYVSAGSIAGAIALPLLMFLWKEPRPYYAPEARNIFIIITAVACFVIYKHRSNIMRLIQGKENKI